MLIADVMTDVNQKTSHEQPIHSKPIHSVCVHTVVPCAPSEISVIYCVGVWDTVLSRGRDSSFDS